MFGYRSLFLLLPILMGVVACTSTAKASGLPISYDSLYPLYAIECSGTGAQKLSDPKKALDVGHALIYLKGVCRDETVNYPKIRKCYPGEKDLNSPDAGTTLSLDDNFVNTRYIAIDGFSMTMNGAVSEQSALTEENANAAVKALLQSGATRGIQFNAKTESRKPLGMSDEEWVARDLLSTSYAVRFGRSNRCVVMPINETMLDAAVSWVNVQNEPYVTGKTEFKWSYTNTCAHFTHDVLAAMGIGEFVKPYSNTAGEIYAISSVVWKPWHPHVELPMNEILSSEEHANDSEIPSAEAMFANANELKAFDRFNRIPTSDGVLIWSTDIHQFDNELYQTIENPILLDVPLFHPRKNKLSSDLANPVKTELATNLKAYLSKIKNALSRQSSYQSIVAMNPILDSEAFHEFYQRYILFLNQNAASIELKLEKL
jgi:hypothetical protein